MKGNRGFGTSASSVERNIKFKVTSQRRNFTASKFHIVENEYLAHMVRGNFIIIIERFQLVENLKRMKEIR